jgi:hypothetical protein
VICKSTHAPHEILNINELVLKSQASISNQVLRSLMNIGQVTQGPVPPAVQAGHAGPGSTLGTRENQHQLSSVTTYSEGTSVIKTAYLYKMLQEHP